MGTLAFLAEALRYPAAGRLETLHSGLARLPDGPAKRGLADFIQRIEKLSLAEWEEIYTHTLDLSPTIAPYVGYQMWSDSYKRGSFMAKINREMQELGIEKDGDLPDHLVPILRYLDASAEPGITPIVELVEVFEPAVQKMRKGLRKTEPNNPYVYLLEAVRRAAELGEWKVGRLEEWSRGRGTRTTDG
jgi:nitrate reductase delta subunit